MPYRKEGSMNRGFAVAANVKTDVIAAAAREAESAGYTSFWVNHPGPFDGLASVGVAARESRRIALGIGVIPLHTRGQASIVDGVRTHALPLDRLWLGVGSPNPKSLDRVREGVAALRKELRTRLVVAALGPKMCRLAGEIADGVLFNWLTPEHAKASAALVREGAQAAQRPVPRLFAYVRLAMGPGAADRVAKEGARYDSVPAYHANFERMGVKPEGTAVVADTPAEIARALARWEGAIDEVVLRALPGDEGVDSTLALLRAAKP
jgi:alkanesulfonate monooxygenase SsuD/methylene tetrahydromethanopterin reductase-like flavin-dependent oxidoreductase (luciferase family)